MKDASGEARAQKPTLSPDPTLELLIHARSQDDLIAAASDGRLTEDLALSFLNRRDLPPKALEALHKNSALAKHKKVRLAIVMHPRTPRHISIPIIRHLYPFELMHVALFPSVPADVKRMAEETITGRIGTISPGERYTLAKQGSGRVAAALLLDEEERIMLAALSNPQMTEGWIAKALRADKGTQTLARAVCIHTRWSRRLEVKTALLINRHTTLAQVAQFADDLPVNVLKDVLYSTRLEARVKSYLKSVVQKRTSRQSALP